MHLGYLGARGGIDGRGGRRQVTLSGNASDPGAFTKVHMFSADEGWFVVTYPKDSRGLISESILHFIKGKLSAITAPFTIVNDLLPVAHNEA